jgi:hypothetical protein
MYFNLYATNSKHTIHNMAKDIEFEDFEEGSRLAHNQTID